MLFLSQLMIRIYLSRSESLYAAPKSDTLLFKRPKDSVHRAKDPPFSHLTYPKHFHERTRSRRWVLFAQ